MFFVSREVLLLKASFGGKYDFFWAAIWSKGWRAASMREAVYVLSTTVPPDPVAPWGGSWSHIVVLVHILCYVARCRGSIRREREDDFFLPLMFEIQNKGN